MSDLPPAAPRDGLGSGQTPGALRSFLSCPDALRQIEFMIEEGELKEAERALLFTHLKLCELCKDEWTRRRRLCAKLRAAFLTLDTAPGFQERVLQALPAADAGNRSGRRQDPELSKIEALARALEHPGLRPSGVSRPRWNRLQRHRLPIGLAALLTLTVGSAWWRLRHKPDPALAPPVAGQLDGPGVLLREGREVPLKLGAVLHAGDLVTAGDRTLHLPLETDGVLLARIHLRAGALLKVENRQQYTLEKGEAYFEVNKDRPRLPEECFDVLTSLGRVRAVGTAFGIRVPSSSPERVTVVVDEGLVRILPLSGPSPDGVLLAAGEETDLLHLGGVAASRAADPALLAWHRQAGRGVEGAVPIPAFTAIPQPAPAFAPGTTVRLPDWNTPVPPVCFRGRTLPENLARLAQHLQDHTALRELARQAGNLGANTRPSQWTLCRPMPLAGVVRWLAREQQLRFETPGLLRAENPGEALGTPETGELPADLEELLDLPLRPLSAGMELGSEKPAPATLEKHLAMVAERGRINLLVSSADIPDGLRGFSRHWTAPDSGRHTTRSALRAACAAAELEWCWYDGLLFAARRERLEELTRVERVVDAEEWMGRPPRPEWQHALVRLVSKLGWNAQGKPACGPGILPALLVNRLMPDGRLFYTTGRSGDRLLHTTLDLIRQGSPATGSPAERLDEQRYTGGMRDLEAFVRLCAQHHVHLAVRAAGLDFPSQAFVNRTLPLGEALEWAARLHGMGVRAEPGMLVVDQLEACYGSPALQTLNLVLPARLPPQEADPLPQALAACLREIYPELFASVPVFLQFKERLAFSGDLRQLAAAQRTLVEWQRRLQEPPPEPPLDLKAWRPAWRVKLEKNLAELFRGDGSGVLPEGSFVSVLRQSGLSAQVRATILVDPEAMKRVALKPIPQLNVLQLSQMQVLQALAKEAGLRVVLEGPVVWLRDIK